MYFVLDVQVIYRNEKKESSEFLNSHAHSFENLKLSIFILRQHANVVLQNGMYFQPLEIKDGRLLAFEKNGWAAPVDYEIK